MKVDELDELAGLPERQDLEGRRAVTAEAGTVHLVEDLDGYDGANICDKIDTCVAKHPILMIDRTWCIYSNDAKDFITHFLRMDVHSLQVDTHKLGTTIFQYLKQRTGQRTTPMIFIGGEFIGGFEDLLELYHSGELEEKYLIHIQEVEDANKPTPPSTVKPLFWFPDKVDGRVVRITGVLICFTSATSAAFFWKEWGSYLAYGLLLDFIFRFLAGAKVSLLGRIAMVLAKPLDKQPRAGRPKQFATMCGIMFSFLGSLFYILPFEYSDYVGATFMGMLACASGMEGFIDFCLGCVFFRIGAKLGIFAKQQESTTTDDTTKGAK